MAVKEERRQLVESSLLGAGVLLVLALFGLVNYFGWKYHQRFDWTGSRLYTLSEKSEGVLGALDRDVEAVVFLGPADELYEPVVELLGRYEATSPRFSVRVVDPQKNLVEAQQLVDQFEIGSLDVIVFASGEQHRVVEAGDLAEYDYSAMQYGGARELTAFRGEEVFTSTLLGLAETRQPKVLFTTGHGEASIDDLGPTGMASARQLLEQDNFVVEPWATLGEESLPEGTDLVVIAGPTSNFLEPEVDLLRAYLEGGGRLLAMLDPLFDDQGRTTPTGLESLLADLGVTIGNDIVVDPGNPLPFFGAETIFVGDYADHPITRSLSQAQLPVIIPLGRSVRLAEDIDAEAVGSGAVELLLTTAEGWGETDLTRLDRVEPGDDDIPGPVSLAVAITAPPRSETGAAEAVDEDAESEADSEAEVEDGFRMVVVGDSGFGDNGQIQSVPNATLLSNIFNWLAARESLVGIPPKSPEQVRLSLTQSQARSVVLLVLVVLPLAVIAVGVAVFVRRRR